LPTSTEFFAAWPDQSPGAGFRVQGGARSPHNPHAEPAPARGGWTSRAGAGAAHRRRGAGRTAAASREARPARAAASAPSG
jgi:hypothetical protein